MVGVVVHLQARKALCVEACFLFLARVGDALPCPLVSVAKLISADAKRSSKVAGVEKQSMLVASALPIPSSACLSLFHHQMTAEMSC